MNYQEFKEEIRTYFENYYNNQTIIRIQPVQKNNGVILDGLSILEPGKDIAPTIYLNPYYLEYQNQNTSFEETVTHILNTHEAYRDSVPEKALLFSDYSAMKSQILFKLINYSLNRDLLKDIPHIPYLDLAICFFCAIETPDKQLGSILIRKEHLKLWNISEQELYEIATENTPQQMPAILADLEQFIHPTFHDINSIAIEVSKDSLPNPLNFSAYVLSNKHTMFGSATLLYEGLLAALSESLQSSFALLPSSVHEVLIIPCNDKNDLADLSKMVRTVNANDLSRDEILSDHAYFYDRSIKALTMGEFYYELNL